MGYAAHSVSRIMSWIESDHDAFLTMNWRTQQVPHVSRAPRACRAARLDPLASEHQLIESCSTKLPSKIPLCLPAWDMQTTPGLRETRHHQHTAPAKSGTSTSAEEQISFTSKHRFSPHASILLATYPSSGILDGSPSPLQSLPVTATLVFTYSTGLSFPH